MTVVYDSAVPPAPRRYRLEWRLIKSPAEVWTSRGRGYRTLIAARFNAASFDLSVYRVRIIDTRGNS